MLRDFRYRLGSRRPLRLPVDLKDVSSSGCPGPHVKSRSHTRSVRMAQTPDSPLRGKSFDECCRARGKARSPRALIGENEMKRGTERNSEPKCLRRALQEKGARDLPR